MRDGLELIDLDQPLTGQRRFISCWLRRRDGLTFIVDPGPASTAGRLVRELLRRGVDRLDTILLTHVHLDHAGGTADVLGAFPGARVFCHPAGIPHLVDPEKLWRGSVAVLKEVAEVYRRPGPVPEQAIASRDWLEQAGIRVLETSGHAPHHLSFLDGDTLFLGEAAGTHLALGDGRAYLRPATPPRFFLDAAVQSLDLLLSVDPPPLLLAFAHYGAAGPDAGEYLRAAREQLLRWVRVTAAELELGRNKDERLIGAIRRRLLAEDPRFALFERLDPDIQQRESVFVRQSLQGIIGYLAR